MMPWLSVIMLAASILAVLYGAHMSDRDECGEQALSSAVGGLLLVIFGFSGIAVSCAGLIVWLAL